MVETPASFGIICDRQNQPPGPKVKVDRSWWVAHVTMCHLSGVVIKEGRPDPAMLTTRPLVVTRRFHQLQKNYGFGGATSGRGSCVVTTLGTLLPDDD